MKHIIKTLALLFFNINLYSQSCIPKMEYKTDKVFVSVDSMKMRYPFLVEVRSDTATINIKIDTPQGEKEILIEIEETEECTKSDSLHYKSRLIGRIKNEDFEGSVTDEKVKTSIVFERNNTKFYLKMVMPQFENSEFEIYMQEKKIKK